jgi:hypothetical protein
METPITKDAMSISDLVNSGPLGRTSLYGAIRSGELTAQKYGSRTIVTRPNWLQFLESLPTVKEVA